MELIGKESVQLTSKQIDELIELIDKEELLEVEEKIEKALNKDKEMNEPKVFGSGDPATIQTAKLATPPDIKKSLKDSPQI